MTILIMNSMSYKICLRDRVFVPNTSISLQILAAEARVIKEEFLLEQQTL
jgi:hypothetical protein